MSFVDVWATCSCDDTALCRQLLLSLPKYFKEDSVFLPNGVLQTLQSIFFGPALKITQGDCQSVAVQEVWSKAHELLSRLPALDETLQDILDHDVALDSKTNAIVVLRDFGKTFDELAKIPTSQLSSTFEAGRLSNKDAANLALGIYTRRRRQILNEVELLTPLEHAAKSLTAKDEVVSIANCSLDAASLARIRDTIASDTALRSLDLRGNNIHLRGSEIIEDFIQRLPNLTHLSAAGNNLLRPGCERILKVVSKLPKLRSLDLSGCRAGENLFKSLQAIDLNHGLTHLLLGSNDLSALKELPQLPNLRVLDLCANRLTSHHVADLSRCIRSPLLRVLNLSANMIDDEGVRHIIQFLEDHKTVREVDVSFNPFSKVGLSLLTEAVRSGLLLNVRFGGVEVDSPEAQQLTQEIVAANNSRTKRLAELHAVPMNLWSTSETEIVIASCVADVLVANTLHGMSGKDLAELRGEQIFSRDDWERLQKVQS